MVHPFTPRLDLPLLCAALVLVLAAGSSAHAATFNIYVGNYTGGNVYQVPDDFGGGAVGAGQLFASGLSGVYAIAGRDGFVYMAPSTGGTIYKKAANAGGAGTGASFANASLTSIYSMTFADSNNLHAVGTDSFARVIDSSGTLLGPNYNITEASVGITYVPGDGIYTTHNGDIRRFTGSGVGYVNNTPAGLDTTVYDTSLQGVAMGPDGYLYVADSGNGIVHRIHPVTGVRTTLISGPLVVNAVSRGISPVGIMFGPDGRLYFSDWANEILYRTELDGSSPAIIATGFSNPSHLTFVLVPEPATLALVGAGALALLRRRRGGA